MRRNKIKTCFIIPAFPSYPCGVGDHVAKISEQLVSLGIEVSVITSKNIDIDPYYKKVGIKIYPEIEKWTISGWKKALKIAKTINPEIVHFEYPSRFPTNKAFILRLLPQTLVFMVLSQFSSFRPKRVITIHEYYQNSLFTRIKTLIDFWINHKIIFVKVVDQNLLKRFTLKSESKTKYMPVGTNIPEIPKDRRRCDLVRKQLDIKENEHLIAYFGFIDTKKGFDDLILALDVLQKECHKFKLMVIGKIKKDNYTQDLLKKIQELGLKNKVVWTGFLNNKKICHFIHAAELGIFPFKLGATSNRSSMIAFVNLGVPVVTTKVTGVTPGFFKDKVNMVLVPPNSPEKLAKAISELIENKQLRKKISQGQKELAQRFNWRESAKVTKEVYEDLVRK